MLKKNLKIGLGISNFFVTLVVTYLFFQSIPSGIVGAITAYLVMLVTNFCVLVDADDSSVSGAEFLVRVLFWPLFVWVDRKVYLPALWKGLTQYIPGFFVRGFREACGQENK